MEGHCSSTLSAGSSQHLSLLAQDVLQMMSNIWSWNGAETSRLPLDRTILPRTSTPSVVMFPAALMDFSPTTEQSNTTFTDVLLMVTWSLWKLPWKIFFMSFPSKVTVWKSPL